MSKTPSSIAGEFFGTYPVRRFKKGDLLLQPEQQLTHIFYLVEGSVTQYDIAPSGNQVIVNAFKPGAFFPMSQALNGTPNQYYFFETASPATIHLVPVNDTVAFLETHPVVALDLLRRVYRGTDGLLRRMAHLMGSNAKNRLIFELLNAAHRFGTESRSGSVVVPLTESDLAKRSGLSRETVSRTIHDLKAAQIVKVTQNGITISRLAELETLLGTEL